jgi:beta-N-acetylhexosaminidase
MTFSDVPTSHPLFRFVEARARSGITSGCGAGNFCPDAPLTRGQMAVFLSLGLGLHFEP